MAEDTQAPARATITFQAGGDRNSPNTSRFPELLVTVLVPDPRPGVFTG